MHDRLAEFWRDRRGTTSIEYVLIAGLVSILIVVGATRIGSNLSTNYFSPVAKGLS